MNITSTRHCSASFVGRFWKKVNRLGPTVSHIAGISPCWIWKGSLNDNGQGAITAGTTPRRSVISSRASWMVNHGDIPQNAFVLHRCDNPSCVNPDHLFLGTQKDNLADMVKKGRQRGCFTTEKTRGVDNVNAKLNWDIVGEIRKCHSEQGIGPTEISKKYGVSRHTVSDVLKQRTWRVPT